MKSVAIIVMPIVGDSCMMDLTKKKEMPWSPQGHNYSGDNNLIYIQYSLCRYAPQEEGVSGHI